MTTSYDRLHLTGKKFKYNGLREWNKIYRMYDTFLAHFWKQTATVIEKLRVRITHTEIRDFRNLQRSLTDGRESAESCQKSTVVRRRRRSARVCLSFFRSTNRRTKVIPQTSKLISKWKRERRAVFVEGQRGWSSRYKLVCISTFVNTKSILSATSLRPSPFSTGQIQIFHLRIVDRIRDDRGTLRWTFFSFSSFYLFFFLSFFFYWTNCKYFRGFDLSSSTRRNFYTFPFQKVCFVYRLWPTGS